MLLRWGVGVFSPSWVPPFVEFYFNMENLSKINFAQICVLQIWAFSVMSRWKWTKWNSSCSKLLSLTDKFSSWNFRKWSCLRRRHRQAHPHWTSLSGSCEKASSWPFTPTYLTAQLESLSISTRISFRDCASIAKSLPTVSDISTSEVFTMLLRVGILRFLSLFSSNRAG